ncbi:MAG: hypothetical protein M3P30_04360 [Chloroflexota bacterium]|nr:hypothetical protein [Chloroflexota bacterium]
MPARAQCAGRRPYGVAVGTNGVGHGARRGGGGVGVDSPARMATSGSNAIAQSVGVAVGTKGVGVGHCTCIRVGVGSPARLKINGAFVHGVGVATAASGAPAGLAHAQASMARTQSTINERIQHVYPKTDGRD